jgi:[acyl-carrier-protein] S-malonyltransferase
VSTLAALFPGQGSQAIGMAHDLYHHSHAAQQVLDEAEATLPGLQSAMWSGPAEVLQGTAMAQPALVAAGVAAHAAYLEAGGPRAAYVAGHSLGEFTALVAAGSLTLADALRLVRKRGEAMQRAVPAGVGAMAAILKLPRAPIEGVVASVQSEGLWVEVANLNAPEQTVISGTNEGVARACELLKGMGGRAIALKVSAPFHCRLMQGAADALAPLLAEVPMQPLHTPLLANVSAEVVNDPELERRLLFEQVTAPVRWVESVERLAALGVTRYLEFGAGAVLTGLVGRTLNDPAIVALAVFDTVSLKEALA